MKITFECSKGQCIGEVDEEGFVTLNEESSKKIEQILGLSFNDHYLVTLNGKWIEIENIAGHVGEYKVVFVD